ncbi:MAG: ABC transporter ATP-binding protein/permease [Oscillospiraceae bacterium]|nr:ABC transporter ATP-binding protein/permease [Oscillospiraceae bacterium]
MLKLARYLKEFKLNVIVGPLCKLTEAIFELIVPLVMAQIIDVGIKNGDSDYIWKNGIILIILAVCGLSFALVCQYMASAASQGVGTRLRADLYSHINTLSFKELDRLGTAAFVTRITNDVNQVQTAVAMLIRLVVRAPFLVIGATIMSFSISPRLSLIFFGAMAAIVLVMFPIMKATVKLFKKQQKSLDGISRITRENLSGVRVVRAFARQDYEKQRFEAEAEEYRTFAVKAGRINALLNPAIFIAVNVAYLLIVWLGGGFTDAGIDGLTQGKVIALVNYMTQISLALVVVANLVTIFTKAAASSARINEIFDMESSIKSPESSPKTDENAPFIAFDNVNFSYAGEENSLENITFTLNRGETLGIIGGTGSGKTTLAHLLCRFYDVNGGAVKIGGADVRDYPTEELRRKIAVVPQKTELLSGSLRYNMTLGRDDIPDEQIYRALEVAQAKEFTDNLDGGLDAKILQGGKNFSGGQKQRLAIARAIARGSEIIIFDDSSSALDYSTDAKLRKALGEMNDITCVIISQRPNSIKHADKIIVLDDGQAVGIGTHDELLNTCEVYREICKSTGDYSERGEENG